MEVHLHDNSEAKFYDIHHNAVVYIDKLEGDYTPEMHEGNQEGLSKEQLNDIVNATKSLVGKSEGKPKDGSKPKTTQRGMKVKDATYTYKFQKECPLAITNLYQALINAKWIDASTKKEVFQKLFSGESGTFTIKWRRDSIQLLWYLFKLIKDRDYVTRPAGVSVWQIEKCHFVDKNDRVIEAWSSQHEPLQYKDTVEKMVDLLDPLEAVLDQFMRQEQRLDRDTARRLIKERMNANRRHDDDDD